ncbi:hypothetical protein DAH37_27615 [Escherichia coli]|nr:hypothetical protein [Escherichia coli]EEZ5725999.1 hypothetical protein [Escherichia coli O25]EEV5864232.1 hypothetical protein [Escherichia coli]EEW8735194.1 hypothetical protein [Escherichia coli]EFB1665650.1 hypothetical protein [Escherichia coli]
MLTGAFLCLPYSGMPEADSLKHPQLFYLTILFPQIVLSSTQISPIPPQLVSLTLRLFPSLHRR